jgi:hypothetical protein
MQVQDTINSSVINNSNAINELSFAGGIGLAVESGKRADFALLLAMLSHDVRDIEPVEPFDHITESEDQLRIRLGVKKVQSLASDEESYTRGAAVAHQFHSGGIQSAKLQDDLSPDALAYLPHTTQGLSEEVYRNLSTHDQRILQSSERAPASTNNLYQKLVVAQRTGQIQAQV